MAAWPNAKEGEKMSNENGQKKTEDEKKNTVNTEKTAEKGQKNDQTQPRKGRCPKCGSETENGKCPVCGYKQYVPMDTKKLFRIRLILGAILVAGLIIWAIVTQS